MVAQLWEVGVIQEWALKQFVNVIHVNDQSGARTAQDVCDAVSDAWTQTNSFADVAQTTDISYLGCRTRNITSNLATTEQPWTNGTTQGQVAEETIPPSVACCFTLKTGFAGRTHRGRIYLAGLPHSLYASEQVKFNLGGSTGVLVSGAGEAFRATLAGNNIPLQVYSRKNGTGVDVVTALPHEGLASQRRRANRYAKP